MVRSVIYLILLISSTVFSQTEEQKQVKRTIDTFFEGFHKGDTIILKFTLAEEVILQTAYKNKEGKSILVNDEKRKLIDAIGNRPDNQKWEERLLDYNIQVDGNMANAWTPYEFWYNGVFSHCGVNSFQLFNDNDKWKIIYMIDTRRRANCEGY